MRLGELYIAASESITFATFGVTPVKGARSHVTPCPGCRDRRAMLVDLAARANACCGCTGGSRASARTRRRPRHVGMRAAHT